MPDSHPEMIDRFELLEPLGEGGMGSVYRARDTVIGRLVALKIIDLSGFYSEAEQDEARARVLREARAAGALSHPHIVAVHDAGEEGDSAWIVQELVEGAPFRPGAYSVAKTVELLGQSASALDYAHAHGVVHRDVKPSNLLIDANGRAKLADFGIAKLASADQMTRTGSLLGTPQYISPEQLHEHEVGPRSDQFSLAVVAYEALAGKKPFDADSIAALFAKILSADPSPPSSANPDLPVVLDQVLLRALAKAPEERFASCGEFTGALAEALTATAGPAPPPADERSPRRWAAPTAVALVLIAGAGAWFVVSRPETEPAAPSTPPQPALESPVEPAPPEASRTEPIEAQQSRRPQPPAPAQKSRPSSAPAVPQTDQPDPTSPSAQSTTESLGPAVSVVWTGRLEAGRELVIDRGQPSSGSLSRTWPQAPMAVEVSPSSIEIVERPSEANDWSVLRLRSPDAPRSLIILRYRPEL